MPEHGAIATMPENLSYEEATAVGEGVLTSVPFLRDKAKIKSAQKILVNGASGAVGTAAFSLQSTMAQRLQGCAVQLIWSL